MGFVKRYNRYYQSGKRKYNRAKVWANTPQTPKALAIQAYKGVKYLKGIINSELHHHDNPLSVVSIPNTGLVTHLTGLNTGDTDTTRTGNSILLKNLTYRYLLEVNASVTTNTSVSVIIFLDTQQIADTTPTPTQVLSTASPQSLLNLTAQGRFKIIKRQNFVLTPSSGVRPAIEIKGYIPMNKHVKFNNTTSTDIQKNGLYLLVIADEATNTPTINGNFRIAYYDN